MPEGQSKAEWIPEIPRPLYSLRIRTDIHCGNRTLGKTKRIKSGGLSDLRSFIYLFKKHLLSTRHQEKCENIMWIMCFRSHQFQHAAVLPRDRHRSLFKPRCFQIKWGNTTKASVEKGRSLGSALSLVSWVQLHTSTEHGLASKSLHLCPLLCALA